MPRSKKKIIAETVEKMKETQIDVSMEHRLFGCARGEPEHIIFVGNFMEKQLMGGLGAIIKALTAGRVSLELENSKTSDRSPEFILGRLSMANDLFGDFQQFVIDKDKLLEPKHDTDKGVEFYNYEP